MTCDYDKCMVCNGISQEDWYCRNNGGCPAASIVICSECGHVYCSFCGELIDPDFFWGEMEKAADSV